jgi:hypothetical protein
MLALHIVKISAKLVRLIAQGRSWLRAMPPRGFMGKNTLARRLRLGILLILERVSLNVCPVENLFLFTASKYTFGGQQIRE